ncbi:hypothetical protein LY76DRAFT_599599 [Colletotrichum caudatum]|nr:hypothetical protein LY76DRAFT_599599 [Colletotrichum caudatum]
MRWRVWTKLRPRLGEMSIRIVCESGQSLEGKGSNHATTHTRVLARAHTHARMHSLAHARINAAVTYNTTLGQTGGRRSPP